MKIFMDTANTEEVKRFADWGIVHGVTTNPSLIAQSGKKQADVIAEMSRIIGGPVSVEVISTDCAGMVEEARCLSKIADNIVVKIPCIPEGVKAVRILADEGIRTNVTLVFSVPQALAAALAGASYVSPFIGRLDDIGEDGVLLVEKIMLAFKLHEIKTQVIAASVRSMQHVEKIILTGCHIATIPAAVLEQMLRHPLTDKGLKKFLEDYEKSFK